MQTLPPVVTKLAILAGLLATASLAPTIAASAASSPVDDPDVKAQIGLLSAWLDAKSRSVNCRAWSSASSPIRPCTRDSYADRVCD